MVGVSKLVPAERYILLESLIEYDTPNDGLNLFNDIKASESVPILLSSYLTP